MQPRCPSTGCCKHSGYTAQFAAFSASVKNKISSPPPPNLSLWLWQFSEVKVLQLVSTFHHIPGQWEPGLHTACGRMRVSWGLVFAAFCQAARLNPFRHKEDIFRITNAQSVTGQTKLRVSENCCSGRKTEDTGKRGCSALQSNVKYMLNLSWKKISKSKLAKPTNDFFCRWHFCWLLFLISETLDLCWGLLYVKK